MQEPSVNQKLEYVDFTIFNVSEIIDEIEDNIDILVNCLRSQFNTAYTTLINVNDNPSKLEDKY